MSCEERRLTTKIHMIEDDMLRSKNPFEIENLSKMLVTLRRKLQKLQYKKES